MTSRPNPIALRPDFKFDHHRPSDLIAKAVIAAARNVLNPGLGVEAIGEKLWPGDRDLQTILRAATLPASTGGWGTSLASTVSADLLTSLGPVSAGSELLRRALALSFGRNNSIFIPTITSSASTVAFVQEGAPVPIKQLLLGGPILTRRKFGVGFVLTRETIEASTPNAERLVRQALNESVGLALDAALFDNVAGDDVRPAGLRHGISALTATTGGTNEAMISDLVTLASAVSPVAGSQIAFVANPAEAITITMRLPQAWAFPTFASSGCAPGRIMAVALNCLAAAVDSPRIEASEESVYHVEDTTPNPINAGTFAAPVRSLWQTDCIGIRLTMDVSWGLRATGSVAWIDNVTW